MGKAAARKGGSQDGVQSESKDLLPSTGSAAQHSVITDVGKALEKEQIQVYA